MAAKMGQYHDLGMMPWEGTWVSVYALLEDDMVGLRSGPLPNSIILA
jgi:hypothetical protein